MLASIDLLEYRQLLSTTYGRFDASKGVLRLFGSPDNDTVEIQVGLDASPTDSNGNSDLLGLSIRGSDGNATTFSFHRGELRTLRLYLGAGDDTVGFRTNLSGKDAFAAEMIVDAGAGNDTIVAGNGNDRIDGGTGSDDIRAGRGDDIIYAGAGNDRVRTQGGNDTVYGGRGDDRIFTDDTGTTLDYGQSGKDTLSSGKGRDTFYGGAGLDLVDYSDRAEPLYIDLSSGDSIGETLDSRLQGNQPRVRNLGLFDDGRRTVDEAGIKPHLVPSSAGFAGTGRQENDALFDVENATGGSGGDVLTGSSHANVLSGGAGDDTLFAGAGLDDLFGDAGNDQFLTVDRRYHTPYNDPENVDTYVTDHIDGGPGKDFARYDASDTFPGDAVETKELLSGPDVDTIYDGSDSPGVNQHP